MIRISAHLAIAASIAGSALLPSTASAQDDLRAKDAFELFKAFCVDTNGTRQRAISVLGDGNALANRLPEAAVSKLQGQPGGIAWVVRSPNQAQLLLGYTASGICEIRVAEADEASIVREYDALVPNLGATDGAVAAPETRQQENAQLTFRSVRFKGSGKSTLLAMTTSDKKVGEQQHLITFGFVQ